MRLFPRRPTLWSLPLFGLVAVLSSQGCGSGDKHNNARGESGAGGEPDAQPGPGGVPGAAGQPDAALGGEGPSNVGGAGAPSAAGGVDGSGAGAGGVQAGGRLVTFVEDFLSTEHVDLVQSTASVDTAGVGRAFGPAPFQLGDPGSGTDGAYAVVADATLSAGEHEFVSFDATNAVLDSPGDLTLRVQGDFILDATELDVTGSLTLYVGGQLRMSNDATLYATGPVVVHQLGNAAMVLDNSYIFADQVAVSAPLEVFSRAAIDLRGGLQGQGDGPSGSSDLVVRSGGSITLGDANTYAFVQTDDSASQIGNIGLYTEGALVVANGGVNSNSGPATEVGQDIEVRAVGGFDMGAYGFFSAAPAGVIDIVVSGPFTLPGGVLRVEASSFGSGSITARASSIDLSLDGRLTLLTPPNNYGPTSPGLIDLRTTGDFTVAGDAYLAASDTYCDQGGSIHVEAEGDITFGPTSAADAGSSPSGVGGCSGMGGGDLTLLAAGNYVAEAGATLNAGSGTPPGVLTALGGQTVSVGPIDPGLIAWTTVTSAALPVEGPGAIFDSASLVWALQRSEAPVIEISLDGSDTWLPLGTAVGKPLVDGWRYRVQLSTGQFDAMELDRIELSYTMP